MKILVNGEAIDFTLQGEETLGEIIPPLRDWLADSDYSISSLRVDGEPIELDKREQWEEIDLKGIESLTVSASSLVQEQLDGVETAMEFLVLLRRIIEAGDQERLAEALMEYNYLREALPTFLSSRYEDGTQMRDYFDELLDRTGAINGTLPSEGEERRELLRGVDSLISLLEARAREIVQPVEEFLSIARAIAGSLESIEEVPVLLQTGEGANAMRRLAGFTGLVERLVRLYPLWAEENDGKEADFEELNEVLAELIQALGDEDSVLVGDLVEYEIVPKVEAVLESTGVKRPTSA